MWCNHRDKAFQQALEHGNIKEIRKYLNQNNINKPFNFTIVDVDEQGFNSTKHRMLPLQYAIFQSTFGQSKEDISEDTNLDMEDFKFKDIAKFLMKLGASTEEPRFSIPKLMAKDPSQTKQ